MNVRRSAAALAAVGVLAAAAPATAADASPSASPKVSLPAGLFGKADPTYDGVWRQSLALLAQRTAGERSADSAVGWLAGQQCDNGGFAAFRADTAKPCGGKSGAQPDTNSTAAAVQALQAVGGHDGEVRKAVTWLKGIQGKDGGWGYSPGGPSDTNSTSVVIGALASAGEDPTRLHTAGKTPEQALTGLSLACSADGGGAFAYQPDKKGTLVANADATAAGVLGALGKGFVVTAGKLRDKAPACSSSGKATPARLADNASAYLAGAVAKTGHLMSAMPGATDQPDVGNTADTVVALAADGWTEQAKKPYAWLEKNGVAWAEQTGPAAYAQLILTAHAMGEQPRNFGGTDLVQALDKLGPAPQQWKKAGEHEQTAEKKDSGSGAGVWWIVGVGLVAGIGIGFLLSGRKKRQP
ncbi:prenyltransferase/squalene oxidase repeat-containing protein [Streptomyces sp. NPDC047085]|uniref:prenyltransferase/squalene oxidase repeat-containing protein n=1 Tax=Streptomyces sp. NPDC047085 TaxID=3155140 RepID=UPI0033E155FF